MSHVIIIIILLSHIPSQFAVVALRANRKRVKCNSNRRRIENVFEEEVADDGGGLSVEKSFLIDCNAYLSYRD